MRFQWDLDVLVTWVYIGELSHPWIASRKLFRVFSRSLHISNSDFKPLFRDCQVLSHRYHDILLNIQLFSELLVTIIDYINQFYSCYARSWDGKDACSNRWSKIDYRCNGWPRKADDIHLSRSGLKVGYSLSSPTKKLDKEYVSSIWIIELQLESHQQFISFPWVVDQRMHILSRNQTIRSR